MPRENSDKARSMFYKTVSSQQKLQAEVSWVQHPSSLSSTAPRVFMARYSKIGTLAISCLRPCPRKLDIGFPTRLNSTSSNSKPISATSHSEVDIKYNWVDGAEQLEHYVFGGYHPIMIGDVLHDRYSIVDKLGFGGYSTVWLARDTRLERYVAVKVGIATAGSDSLLRETKNLHALSASQRSSASMQHHPGRDFVPCLLDEFKVHGPNGTHICYTTTPARCNLGEACLHGMFPLEVARALLGGLTLAVSYTHSLGYVRYKGGNIFFIHTQLINIL